MTETWRITTLALRASQARPEIDRMASSGASHRAFRRFGTVLASDMGAGTDWSVQLTPAGSQPPLPGDLRGALAWCADRPSGVGLVALPEPFNDGFDPHEYGLDEFDRLPVLAVEGSAAAALRSDPVSGLQLGPPRDLTELLTVYGGWMQDDQLAARLVVPADLASPQRRFLVARIAGQGVGCAFVWFAAGTAYISGLGVVPAVRGRGVGAALAVAAAGIAAAGSRAQAAGVGEPDSALPVDVVWMYATDAGARLYRRLGFVPAGSVVRYLTRAAASGIPG